MITITKLRAFFLVASFLSPSMALADGESAQSAVGATTQGTMDALQDQIAILTAQEKIANLKAQIETDDRGKNSDPPVQAPIYPSSPVPGLTASVPKPASSPAPAPAPMPVIISIQGRGDDLSAMLLLPSGEQIMATPGADIGDGLMVHDVSANGVNVIQGGSLVPLQFEGVSPARATPQ